MRYRGYFYDTETKLYYLQSRYYSPELRRFICGDIGIEILLIEQGNILGANVFLYCENNPVMYIDKDGCSQVNISGNYYDVIDKYFTYKNYKRYYKQITALSTSILSYGTKVYLYNDKYYTSENKFKRFFNLTELQKKFAALVSAEALGTRCITEYRAVAHVIMNRVGKYEWREMSLSNVIMSGAFTGYDSKLYNSTLTYLNSSRVPTTNKSSNNYWIEKVVETVIPVYYKEDYDITKGCVFFNSHGPTRYTGKEIKVSGTKEHRFFYINNRHDWSGRVMKRFMLSLLCPAIVLAIAGCTSKAEINDTVSQTKSVNISSVASAESKPYDERLSNDELSIDNYKSIAAKLEDWQELFVEDNIKIYQSTSESTLFKYEIVLEENTFADYSYISSPEIEYLTDDVIKVSRSLGSNLASVEYLKLADGNVTNKSEEFFTYGYSTEYIAADNMLVAYTGSVSRGDMDEVAVIVRDIFNGSEKAAVVRDYYALADVVESMKFTDADTLNIVYKRHTFDNANGYKTVTENINL